jgi:hypothetical protein
MQALRTVAPHVYNFIRSLENGSHQMEVIVDNE